MVTHVKKTMIIGLQILFLYLLSWIGTWIQHFFNLAIPGSVIGLILLFLLLLLKIIPVTFIEAGASLMTRHLVLFFIPATVGIMNYYYLFQGRGVLLIIVTIVSTIIVMISAGYVSQKLADGKVQ